MCVLVTFKEWGHFVILVIRSMYLISLQSWRTLSPELICKARILSGTQLSLCSTVDRERLGDLSLSLIRILMVFIEDVFLWVEGNFDFLLMCRSFLRGSDYRQIIWRWVSNLTYVQILVHTMTSDCVWMAGICSRSSFLRRSSSRKIAWQAQRASA